MPNYSPFTLAPIASRGSPVGDNLDRQTASANSDILQAVNAREAKLAREEARAAREEAKAIRDAEARQRDGLARLKSPVLLDRAIGDVEKYMVNKFGVNLEDFVSANEGGLYDSKVKKLQIVNRAVRDIFDSVPSIKAMGAQERAIFNTNFRSKIIDAMVSGNYTPNDVSLLGDGDVPTGGAATGGTANRDPFVGRAGSGLGSPTEDRSRLTPGPNVNNLQAAPYTPQGRSGARFGAAGYKNDAGGGIIQRVSDSLDALDKFTGSGAYSGGPDAVAKANADVSLAGRAVGSTLTGAGNLVSGLARLTSGVTPTTVNAPLARAGDYSSWAGQWVKNQTEDAGDAQASQQLSDAFSKVSVRDGFLSTQEVLDLGSAVKDLFTTRGGALIAADSAGFMVGSFGLGGKLAKGVVGAANAIRGTAGLGAIGAAGAEFATAGVTANVLATAAKTGSVLGGGLAVSESVAAPYEAAERAVPMDEYKKSINFERARRYLGEDASDEQVRELAISTSTAVASALGLAAGLVGSGFGNVAENALLNPKGVLAGLAKDAAARGGQSATRAAVSSGLRVVGKEAAGEFAQEALQAAAPSVVNARSLDDINVDEIVKNGIIGAVFGGAIAGSASLAAATGGVLSAKSLAVASAMEDAAQARLVESVKARAAEGDTDAQAMVDDPVGIANAFSTLRDTINAKMAQIAGDGRSRVNDTATHVNAQENVRALADEGAQDSILAGQKLGSIDIYTGAQLASEGATEAIAVAKLVRDPLGQLDAVPPRQHIEIVQNALQQQLSDLSVPFLSKATGDERVLEVTSAIQTYASDSPSIVETAQLLSDGSLSSSRVRNDKLFARIEAERPDLAGDIASVRRMFADQQAVKTQLAKIRAIKKQARYDPTSVASATAVTRGLNTLAAQNVGVSAKRSRLGSGAISISDVENQPDGRDQFSLASGKAKIDRTQSRTVVEKARQRQKQLKALDAGVSDIVPQRFDVVRSASDKFNAATGIVPAPAGIVANAAGFVLNGPVRLLQRLANSTTNDLSAFRNIERILAEPARGGDGTREYTQQRGAGVEEAAFAMRARTHEIVGRNVAQYVEPVAALRDEIVATAAADLGLAADKVDHVLDLYPMLNDVAARAKDIMVGRHEELTLSAKVAMNDATEKLRNGGPDVDPQEIYARKFAIVNDPSNYAIPTDYKAIEDIAVNVTTERMGERGNALSVTAEEAARLMEEADASYGPNMRAYADLIVAGHAAMLDLREATGDIPEATLREIRAKNSQTYVPRSGSRDAASAHGQDGEDITFRNRGLRSFQGGDGIRSFRSAQTVLEDAVVSAAFSSTDKPYLRSMYNLALLAKEKGFEDVIEVRDALPDLLDAERGVFVPQDVPGLTESNKFRLVVGGKSKIVTIKDQSLADAHVNAGQPTVNETTETLKKNPLVKGTLAAGRVIDRLRLLSATYHVFTAPARDWVESFNEVSKKAGFGPIKQGAALAGATIIKERSPIGQWIHGSITQRAAIEADLRKRAGSADSPDALNPYTAAGRARLTLEFMEDGIVTPFSEQIRPESEPTKFGTALADQQAIDASRSSVRKALSEFNAGVAASPVGTKVVNGALAVVKVPTSWQDAVQTASDYQGRFMAYTTARVSGLGRSAAASISRDSLNFQKRGGVRIQGAVDVASIFSPFARTGVLGIGKLPGQVWAEGKAPTVTERAADGSLRTTLDSSRVVESISLRPVMTGLALTALRFPIMATALGSGVAAGILGSGESDDDKLKRGVGVAPRGLGSLPADQLIAANILPYGFQTREGAEDVGHISFKGVSGAYGLAPMLAAGLTAAMLLVHGDHSHEEVVDGLERVLLRNVLPVGDANVADFLGDSSVNWSRRMLVALTPKIVEPLSRIVTNTSTFGGPLYTEANSSRDALFAQRDAMFADMDKSDFQLVSSQYLGGLYKIGETLLHGALASMGGKAVDDKAYRLADFTPGREISSERYADTQYSQIYKQFYQPMQEALHNAKTKDVADGYNAKGSRAGPAERAIREADPQAFAAFSELKRMQRERTLARKEIAKLSGTTESGAEDVFEANSVARKALYDKRSRILVEGLNDVARKYPKVILPLLD